MACTPVALPVVEADFCAPDIDYGEISFIYLGNLGDGNEFTDWTTITEWNTRLDNTDIVSAASIRTLHVIGDKPAPERTEIEFSQNRKAYTTPKHTLNVRVDETGDDNYALVRFLDTNPGQQYRIWYAGGKYLYGGNEGVSANFVLDNIIPESREELVTFTGVVSWEGIHPERTVNPLA